MKRAAVWSILAGITALVLAIVWAGARVRTSTGIDEARPGDAPIGTAGYQTPSDSEDSPATIHDLETMTGAIDPHELIGGRVDFHLKVGEVRDGTSFWVGHGDNHVLVVPRNKVQPVMTGEMVRITGTIEKIPKGHQVYIRADAVTPE